jgi:hypothetical protein
VECHGNRLWQYGASVHLIDCGQTGFQCSHCSLLAGYNLVVDLIFIIENYWVVLNTDLIGLQRYPASHISCCLVSGNVNRLFKYMHRLHGGTGVVCGSLISEVKILTYVEKRDCAFVTILAGSTLKIVEVKLWLMTHSQHTKP